MIFYSLSSFDRALKKSYDGISDNRFSFISTNHSIEGSLYCSISQISYSFQDIGVGLDIFFGIVAFPCHTVVRHRPSDDLRTLLKSSFPIVTNILLNNMVRLPRHYRCKCHLSKEFSNLIRIMICSMNLIRVHRNRRPFALTYSWSSSLTRVASCWTFGPFFPFTKIAIWFDRAFFGYIVWLITKTIDHILSRF